ncbi:adenylate/guanylate cyclase domain-containing protein [Vineibacter terrae]|uniref:adenylate/guanylate cyclase domain-containing protein n=1 Tax=Vineibacter terrae TaxID=2586908 RepID=UPI002E360A86|nr:adenylate/guanylate cyclase domain-containing protein [Vineibacter terrae]HEX2886899.1 adenylate/guanylate cyclase domain-containing protein [Vineibacter terrae]
MAADMRLARLRRWLMGDAPDDGLPARVLDTIRAQQDRSEIMVSVAQLLAIGFFATLYGAAPMAQGQIQPVTLAAAFDLVAGLLGIDLAHVGLAGLRDAADHVEFVFGVLGIYAVVTLLRLILALRRQLTPWMLYASAIIDMALLMAVIWSFHLKYAQTAAFYLKAPTFVYVFIFIALRALRFEARYVLFAGAMGALGWAILLLIVLSGHGGPPNVTHDYTEYLTSNATLIGAEVDKIVAVLLVTSILALAITRARRLLVRAVAERIAAQDLSRFLAPEVADRIRRSELRIAAGEGELRDVTILTTDLRAFSGLSATMAPDSVVKLLQDYQARVCPAIRAAGGSIDKYLGDGILSSFGAAQPSGTDAADALRAADAVAAAVAAWNAERTGQGLPPMRVGMALASGRVIFGAVGDGDRLEYTVIGDAVNRAAKLEKHTKAENVRALCDATTYDRAVSQGYAPPAVRERRAARQVDGVAAPVDLVIITP